MELCVMPGCSKPVKNWRTHFCGQSCRAKYGHTDLPKKVRVKKWRQLSLCLPTPVKPYKDLAPEQKGAHVARVSARQQRVKQATPKWANVSAIKEFYIGAQRLSKETGIPHEVDHIIPLQGKLVSGLHVPTNLQILTEKENQQKNAKFTVLV
jgi:hypothetical protein